MTSETTLPPAQQDPNEGQLKAALSAQDLAAWETLQMIDLQDHVYTTLHGDWPHDL